MSAFQEIGYETCAGDSVEIGYEKVALYVDQDGFWTHAAKQLSDGEWTSKLGDCEDIRHRTPHAVASSLYGQVMFYMRRKIIKDISDGEKAQQEAHDPESTEPKGGEPKQSPEQGPDEGE